MRKIGRLCLLVALALLLAGAGLPGPSPAGEDAVPLRVALVTDAGSAPSSPDSDLARSVRRVLTANLIPYDILDIATATPADLLDEHGHPRYGAFLVQAAGARLPGATGAAIRAAVAAGAGAVGLLPEVINLELAPIFGVITPGTAWQAGAGIRIERDEFTFAYAGETIPQPGVLLLDHALSVNATVVARETASDRPAIWTHSYARGRTVFYNDNGIGNLYCQGILLQSILYVLPVGLAAPVAAGAINVDDCPRKYGNGTEFSQLGSFTVNFIPLLARYHLPATFYLAFSYSGNLQDFWANPASLDEAYQLLLAGYELGLHCGSAHLPLEAEDWGSAAALTREIGVINQGLATLGAELARRYGVVLPEVISYAAPQNCLGPDGYRALDHGTTIRYVSTVNKPLSPASEYPGGSLYPPTVRDFGWEPGTGLYNLPRAQADFYYFAHPESPKYYHSLATLQAMLESGQPYLIFTHIDEHALLSQVEPAPVAMADVFTGYTAWADFVTEHYPFYRWMTSAELGELLTTRPSALAARWLPGEKVVEITNFVEGEALQVKTPLYLSNISKEGGTLRLSFSETPVSYTSGEYDVVKTGANYFIYPLGTEERLAVRPARPFHFQALGANRAPVLTPPAELEATAGRPLRLTVSATDADGDPLTYLADNLPAGATFDRLSHTLSWTPPAGGVANLRFGASDGRVLAWATTRITVRGEAGPVREIRQAVASGADDGFLGTWAFTSSTVWFEAGNPGQPYSAWFRFTGITIPKGAAILEAYLEIAGVRWTTGTSLIIYAEKSPRPTAPTGLADYNTRPRSLAGVDWRSAQGGTDYQRSPNLTAVVQELVEAYDYSRGGTLLLCLDNHGSAVGAELAGRAAESGTPPRLYLRYEVTTQGSAGQEGGAPPAPAHLSPLGLLAWLLARFLIILLACLGLALAWRANASSPFPLDYRQLQAKGPAPQKGLAAPPHPK